MRLLFDLNYFDFDMDLYFFDLEYYLYYLLNMNIVFEFGFEGFVINSHFYLVFEYNLHFFELFDWNILMNYIVGFY